MIDLYKNNLKGILKFECLDSERKVIDTFIENNLIMNNARTAISLLGSGISTAEPINKLVLGTEGHIPGDYLTPKTEDQGFNSARTELFSETSATFNYPIEFAVPGTPSGTATIISEPDSGTVITVNYDSNSMEYTFEIPELAANGTGISTFTEAALYAGDNIFSMKCFPAKIKDATVSLRVIWKIIY